MLEHAKAIVAEFEKRKDISIIYRLSNSYLSFDKALYDSAKKYIKKKEKSKYITVTEN